VSPYDPTLRRQFCGYCGTQLTQWREDAEDDCINVTLGSIFEEDLERLEEEGVLSSEQSAEEEGKEEVEDEESMKVASTQFGPLLGPRHRGAPWYESLVGNTPLGRVKRQKGGHMSGDGMIEVEWEVFELTQGDSEDSEEGNVTPGKRKISEVEESEDQEMRA
jgi:hypothetical protein